MTLKDIIKLQDDYQEALNVFLLDNGWECSADRWETWSKNGEALLNNEEALYREQQYHEGV